MNAHPTQEHIDTFVAHISATLPDSIRARKTVLIVLLDLLPKKHTAHRTAIIHMLESLRIHESKQLELAGITAKLTQP